MTLSRLEDINHLKNSLEKEISRGNKSRERCLDILTELSKCRMDLRLLSETLVGRVVSELKKSPDEQVASCAKSLIKKWKAIVRNAKKSVVHQNVDNTELKQARHVCVKVPAPRNARRKLYESWEEEHRRGKWISHVLGKGGVYVGRPKCDGGWYMVPEVKAGSMFANPYNLKDYSLQDSLALYKKYLQKRMETGATADDAITLLPQKQAKLAKDFYFGKTAGKKGKSTAHMKLNLMGKDFAMRLRELKGKCLGCFCDENVPCHAKVLSNVVNIL